MKYPDRIGKYKKCSVAGEFYQAYIPNYLPPKPAVQLEDLNKLLEEANVAVGRLDGLSMILPDPSLFLYMYVRKEAVLSSQIEGTQSSLSDLLQFENQGICEAFDQDIMEVSNYVAAMVHGLQRIDGGFPLSLRLIREMHEILLKDGRGSFKQPGEFRHSQNWVGGTRPGNARFVPPPQEILNDLLHDLEKFLHDETVKLPTLIKAGIAHVQFETIHTFLDGNGRLGRLLITFILCVEGMLKKPLLYLSLYFKTHRQLYYDYLQLVRETGNWEDWLQFFLQGIVETADQAVSAAQSILRLFADDQQKIVKFKSTVSTLTIFHYLQRFPISNAKKISEHCKLSLPTTNKVLANLLDLNIVKEITQKSRNKLYVYQEYLDILNEGAIPNTFDTL